MLTPFDLYVNYVALKRHFIDWKYDYVKYGGKVRLSRESFEKRNDKFYFNRLERHIDPIGLLTYNLCDDPRLWIRDIMNREGQDRYLEHRRRIESMSRVLQEDLEKLDPDFNKNFDASQGHPPLVKAVMGKKITLETASILVELAGATDHLRAVADRDELAESVIMRILKFRPFLDYDLKKGQRVVLNFFDTKESVR